MIWWNGLPWMLLCPQHYQSLLRTEHTPLCWGEVGHDTTFFFLKNAFVLHDLIDSLVSLCFVVTMNCWSFVSKCGEVKIPWWSSGFSFLIWKFIQFRCKIMYRSLIFLRTIRYKAIIMSHVWLPEYFEFWTSGLFGVLPWCMTWEMT